jgi:hypothetical protein
MLDHYKDKASHLSIYPVEKKEEDDNSKSRLEKN